MLVACFSPESAVTISMELAEPPRADVKRRVSSVTADLILVVLLWVALVAAKNERLYGKEIKEIISHSQCRPGSLRRSPMELGKFQFVALVVETEARFVRVAAPLLWVEAVNRVVLVIVAVVGMSG